MINIEDMPKDYKEGYRDALRMIIDVAANANEGSELIQIMHAANEGINDAEWYLEYPWH